MQGTARLSGARVGAETDEAAMGRRRREAERWAAALASTLASASAPPLPCRREPGPGDMPSAWQPMDSGLTPAPGRAGGAPASAGTAPGAELSRVCLELEAGDLGSIEVRIDRDPAGVRVLIGAREPGALAALEPERAALERALESSGVRVADVRVVSAPTRGTVLARASGSEPARSSDRDGEHEDRKRTRKSRWIG